MFYYYISIFEFFNFLFFTRMGCLDVRNLGLGAIFRIFVIIVFVGLTMSCSVSDERASNTSFRPVPYQQPPTRVYQQPSPGYGTRYPQPYYSAPNSRSYYNPYDFQQSYGSNPYSDYDQYYVPPVQYYNNEYQGGVDDAYSGSPR